MAPVEHRHPHPASLAAVPRAPAVPAPPAIVGAMARPLSIALIGGLRLGGRVRLGERLVRISPIGGVDLDLGEAEFAPSGRLTVVKVSLIGGATVRVPPGARVEVRSLAIGGRDIEAGAGDGPGPPTVSIWAFAILGGVKVRRSGVART